MEVSQLVKSNFLYGTVFGCKWLYKGHLTCPDLFKNRASSGTVRVSHLMMKSKLSGETVFGGKRLNTRHLTCLTLFKNIGAGETLACAPVFKGLDLTVETRQRSDRNPRTFSSSMRTLQTSRRQISLDRPLVMGILNVTPDSFSDGGAFLAVDDAVRQAERLIGEGADIIDIGGESTRPGSERVAAEIEIGRVVPVIDAISKRFDVAISIDTSKSAVAVAAMDAGAEIINDISGLRFDAKVADVAARTNSGLVLMHSCGEFETMHSKPAARDIFAEVSTDLKRSVAEAKLAGVADANIVLDVGIGFGKTLEQNLELIAKLDRLVNEFAAYPILVGTSRKSFIGKILGGVPPSERLGGSIASALIAIQNGAKIVRVHDVKETVAAIKIAAAIAGESSP